MKKMVNKYRVSKFNRFTNGLLFALIAIIALCLCLTDIANQSTTEVSGIFPFIIAIISMLLGFFTMFRKGEPQNEKI